MNLEDNKYSLSIKVMVPSRCMFGDFDALLRDLMFSKNAPKVYLSLAKADGSNESIIEIFSTLTNNNPLNNEEERKSMHKQMHDYYSELLKSGEEHKISLPKSESKNLYILRICKDTVGSRSCLQKTERPIQDILKVYREPPADYLAIDAVYFYQPVIITDNSIEFVSKYTTTSDKEYLEFLSLAKNPQPIFNKIKMFTSMPLKTAGDSLVIELPVFTKGRCGQ